MGTIFLPEGSEPKYLRLLAGLREAVAAGRLSPGDRLPPVRELAFRLGVTPGTVARSYRMAMDDGFLTAMQGSGTFVAEPGTEQRAPLDPTPPGWINLRTASVPDVGQARILTDLLRGLPDPGPGAYLHYPVISGETVLTRELARWFSGEDHGEIAPEDVTPTFGGQQALVMALTGLLYGPRPVVLSEELTYQGIRSVCRMLRAEIRGLPVDAEGILPEAFDRVAAETGAQVLVTSACVNNPTTRTTSRARREALIAVARARHVAILDDDCFGVVELVGPSYRLMAPEITWVAGTLTKTVSPELRLGAIIAPPGRGAEMRAIAQQHFYGMPQPQTMLNEALLASGAAAEIKRKVRAEIAARVQIARPMLARFGAAMRDPVPFFWLPLPRGWRLSTFVRAGEAEGLKMRAADELALDAARAPAAVRPTVSAVESREELVEALGRLVRLLETPPVEDGA